MEEDDGTEFLGGLALGSLLSELGVDADEEGLSAFGLAKAGNQSLKSAVYNERYDDDDEDERGAGSDGSEVNFAAQAEGAIGKDVGQDFEDDVDRELQAEDLASHLPGQAYPGLQLPGGNANLPFLNVMPPAQSGSRMLRGEDEYDFDEEDNAVNQIPMDLDAAINMLPPVQPYADAEGSPYDQGPSPLDAPLDLFEEDEQFLAEADDEDEDDMFSEGEQRVVNVPQFAPENSPTPPPERKTVDIHRFFPKFNPSAVLDLTDIMVHPPRKRPRLSKAPAKRMSP